MRAVRALAMRRAMPAGLAVIPLLPLLVHEALLTGRWTLAALCVGAGQSAALAALIAARAPRGRRVAIAAGAALAFLWIGSRAARTSLAAAAALSHAALYGGLLLLFVGSLRPGRTPLVTALADRLHGPLPNAVVAYTRRVTWLWVGVFVGQLTASALLLALAPERVWSLFVNVLDLPLVGLVFALEYAWRRRRFRGMDHVPVRRVLAAFAARRHGSAA